MKICPVSLSGRGTPPECRTARRTLAEIEVDFLHDPHVAHASARQVIEEEGVLRIEEWLAA